MSLLEMSFAGAVMILVIIVLRIFTIHKLPKRVFLILWEIVLLRLFIPFSIPSIFSVYSLINRNAPVPVRETIAGATIGNYFIPETTPMVSGIYEGMNQAVQSEIIQNEIVQSAVLDISLWFVLWLAGMLICACYFIIAYWRCKAEFRVSLPIDNIFVKEWLRKHPLKRFVEIRYSCRISAPLTYGVFHPVILMPKNTDWENNQQLQYIFMHEYIHVRRFDTVRKLIATVVLCIHWFNPFVWLMYILYNRDIELTCDESVVRQFGVKSIATYAKTLITMEEAKSGLSPLCNNFSKNAIEERIKAIMRTKKITVGLSMISGIVIITIVVLFATSAERKALPDEFAVTSDSVKETEDATNSMMQETEAENNSEEEDAEESRADFIMIQFKNQIGETTANLYEGDGFSIYVPESWIMQEDYLTAPVKFTVQVSYECSVWIEQYEAETLSDAEARFMEDGYAYDTDKGKWQKAEGTLITQVQLVEKYNDVWAVFRMYNKAHEDSYRVDVVADTCVITGLTGEKSEVPKQDNVYIDDEYYYPPAQYMNEINWDAIGERITEEEYQTLQIYLPVLNGEKFSWIYRSGNGEEPDTFTHDMKQVTIREMLADQMGRHGIKEVEPLVDSFYFANVFESGSESMVLLFRNMSWDWLILHEEDGVIYGIDMPIRWFLDVQKDGLYFGSGGADTAHYYRMRFVNGDYIEEDIGTVINEELYIDGVKKSNAEYETWKKENLKEAAKRYTPLEEKSTDN